MGRRRPPKIGKLNLVGNLNLENWKSSFEDIVHKLDEEIEEEDLEEHSSTVTTKL